MRSSVLSGLCLYTLWHAIYKDKKQYGTQYGCNLFWSGLGCINLTTTCWDQSVRKSLIQARVVAIVVQLH